MQIAVRAADEAVALAPRQPRCDAIQRAHDARLPGLHRVFGQAGIARRLGIPAV